MERIEEASVVGEAALDLKAVAKKLAEAGLPKLALGVSAEAEKLLTIARISVPVDAEEGAGLKWLRAPITAKGTVFCKKHMYHTWQAALGAASWADDGWRLPTPDELKQFYAEKPESPVFAPYSRYESAKEALVAPDTAVLWTSQDDSRDFAIECTVTKEFGITFHPAFKANHNVVWIVKEL